MRTTGGKPQARGRSARWHVKKHDDTLIERWARACSTEHGECRGCEFIESCQDLADRLIGCMGVPATGQCKLSSQEPAPRHAAKQQAVPHSGDLRREPLRVPVAAMR